MFTEQQYAAHERAILEAKNIAWAHVLAACLPERVVLNEESFCGIGNRAEAIACRILRHLNADCGDRLPEVIAIATRMSLYSLAEGAAYMTCGQAAGLIGKNGYVDQMCSPDGYGANEGLAWTLYNNLHETTPMPDMSALREIAEFDLDIIRIVVLEAMAIYWFSLAAVEFRSGRVDGGLNFHAEAFDALALAGFDRGWDAALEEKADKLTITNFAQMGANARHRENRAMREQVFSHLEQHEFPSMDAAAEAMAGKLVPAKFRTVRDWVGQWKKARTNGPEVRQDLQGGDV